MAIVETRTGKVEGVSRAGHAAFYGIPFAAPAGPPSRFQAAERAQPWSGVRAAKEPGLSALQTQHPLPGFSASGPQGEDCLNLNIFTPAADGAKRPVLFWIHGGAFTHGAGSEPLYDGGALATRGDVVVVSINYRLGAFGFLYLNQLLPTAGCTANAGLTDCIAALEWVRDNIAAFGGDPARVTIFGESAGSAAVHALCAMPAAKGHFQRAVLQSGVTRGIPEEDATKTAEKFISLLGLSSASLSDILTMPAQRILDAQAKAAPRGGGLSLAPVVDGVTLPKNALKAAADGDSKHVEMMIGSNRDEAKLFNAMGPREEIDDTKLLRALNTQLPHASESDLRALVDVYRGSRAAKKLPISNLDMLDAVQSDLMFRIAATRLAGAQSAHRSTWLYLFTYASPARRGALGACHALEIPFVFGNQAQELQKRFTGQGPAVDALASEMMDTWIAFAKGEPPRKDWTLYDPAKRATLVFDTAITVENDPFGDEREAVEKLIRVVGI